MNKNRKKSKKNVILALIATLVISLGVYFLNLPNRIYENIIVVNADIILEDFVIGSSWELRTEDSGTRGIRSTDISYLYNPSTGETILAAGTVDEFGNFVEIPLYLYLQMMEENERNIQSIIDTMNENVLDISNLYPEDTSTAPRFISSFSFHQQNHVQALRNAVRITPHVIGPAVIRGGFAETFTESYSFGLSLGVAAQNAVQAGASFNWAVSLQNTTTFDTEFSVPSSRMGAIYFTARDNVTVGILTEVSLGVTRHHVNIIGCSPARVGQFVDGIFELRLS
ncbi:MAG: hypothetical protein FWF57_05535 [Defluviitaleaceae bacterium]|nr:hypothetical protein [Defluviitaleaceae bacterium]